MAIRSHHLGVDLVHLFLGVAHVDQRLELPVSLVVTEPVAFGLRCKEAGVEPSMGSVGDAYDNAMCESFFATLECELLDRRKFQTKA